MLKSVALLALLVGVSCENYTSYKCDKKDCVKAKIGKPSAASWSIQMEDAIFGRDLPMQMFMISNVKANVGIGYTSTKDVIMILNGNTNAAIVVTKRKAYLIDQCKTKMSFEDVTKSKNSFLDVYQNDVVPAITKNSEGFLLRPLFIHLYANKDVKGAPSLKGREDLQDRLGKSFGDVFEKMHEAYKSKTAFVYQYEAGILGLLLGSAEHQDKLRIVMTPLFVFRIISNDHVAYYIHSGLTNYIKSFQEYGSSFWFAQSMFKSYVDGSVSPTVVVNDMTVKDAKGDEYYMYFGTETRKRMYEIKLRKLDGTVDLSILTYPSVDTWCFICRITGLYLVMPGKGRNYGLFQASTGSSIIVDKSTQMAVSSTNNAEKIVRHYLVYEDKLASYEMLRALNTVGVDQTSDLAFNFKSFINKSHGANGLATLRASDKAKEELRKNFGDFIEGFRSIEGFDCHYRSANVALYFFRNVSLAGLKEDYRAMVNVIGVRNSSFHCRDIVYATNLCTFNKYVAK